MKERRYLSVIIVFLCSAAFIQNVFGGLSENTVHAGTALIKRIVPDRFSKFKVEFIPSAEGRDVFEVESGSGKIILRGNNGVSVASALNYYLKNYCRCNVSWGCASQLKMPEMLPPVKEKIRIISPYKYRFAYNYCTHGYTMPWWHWNRWRKELDFLAMQGVNLALVIEGQEQVWIDALKELGYKSEEVRKWLVPPTHQPWQYMSNMESYGGVLPLSLIQQRVELGKKIITAMRELGISPVQQGYYGIIPSDFKKRFPDAKVHAQGYWAGGKLKRPDMLDPLDPLFSKLATAFYISQKKLYGNASFFAADPFHEGGSTKGMNLGVCGKAIYREMQKAAPGSIWVLQSWQANPRQAMINALPKDRLLVLDLYCERWENWKRRKQFGGTPWLWCTIHNFGGNTGLSARLDRIATYPVNAYKKAGPGKGYMKGIGALMEGTGTIPIVWEMLFYHSWHTKAPEMKKWLKDYALCRYGSESKNALDALNIMRKTVYSTYSSACELPRNSAVCGRPSLNPDMKARRFTVTDPGYNTTELCKAWKKMINAAKECSGSDAYRFDLVDLGRQVLGNLGTRYQKRIVKAWKTKDKEALTEYSAKMLSLIRMMDKLTGTRKELLLGPWIKDARDWGTNNKEKDTYEQFARELITTWTIPQSHRDYANREWSGLLGTYYLGRWEIWLKVLADAADNGWKIDNRKAVHKLWKFECGWTRKRNTFPVKPSGDEVKLSEEAYKCFAPDALKAVLE